MPLTLVTAPTVETITNAEAKDQIRLEVDADDTIVDTMRTAARDWAEVFTRRSFINTTWKLVLDGFPENGVFRLPRSPLVSVTSIQYVDTDGDTQTWAASEYRVDTDSEPARITRAFQESFPDTRVVTNSVTVTYVAGYGTAITDVPELLKQGVKLLFAHFYENREATSAIRLATIPIGVKSVLSMYRVPKVA